MLTKIIMKDKTKIPQKNVILATKKTNGFCFYCNNPGYTIDHFYSKSEWKKGNFDSFIGYKLNDIQNLFIACIDCNRHKSKKPALMFLKEKEGKNFDIYKLNSRYSRANKRIGIDSTLLETPILKNSKLTLPLPPFPQWLRDFFSLNKAKYTL